MAEMAAICHENGAKILVDGIQACGVVPLDCSRLGLDAFFTGAHKWLLGVEGVGLSFLSEELMADLTPVTAGWLSHVDGDHFLFRGPEHLRYDRPLKATPQVFEGSTLSALGFVALEAGLDTVSQLTAEEIFLHTQKYHDAVEPLWTSRGFQSLRASDPGLRSCLLSFRPPEGVEVPALAAHLRQMGITVSTPDGLLRLAPHFSNRTEEIPLIAAALEGALAGRS
jgi:selenocysteine lyase/cysteine desulfurase